MTKREGEARCLVGLVSTAREEERSRTSERSIREGTIAVPAEVEAAAAAAAAEYHRKDPGKSKSKIAEEDSPRQVGT